MPFSSFWSWLRSRRASELHFVVYTRHGCHLCDVAWDQLERERARNGFTLETVDVDSNPGLAAHYGDCVPVVTVNGKVRFRGVVNELLLRRLLKASGGR